MKLQISNKNTTLDLTGWTYNISPYKRRVGVQQKYSQNGAWTSGDGKVSSRTIQVSQDLAAKNDTDYMTLIEGIAGIFYDDYAPFYLHDTDTGRRARVELESINETWSHGTERRLTRITINLIMLDAFFENNLVESISWLNVANTNTKIITNSGLVDAFPVITVTALADNAEFSIINQNTEDSITIGTNLFTTGIIVTIDCVNGNVTLSDGVTEIDISYAIADGTGFIFFDLDANVLEYQSIYGNVNINIEYRPLYLF